jgi:LCP family protein required for cell wall assembly
MIMTGRGHDGRDPDAPRRSHRHSTSSEDRLRALGDLMDGPGATTRTRGGGAGRSERSQPGGTSKSAPRHRAAAAGGTREVANQEGLAALGEAISRQGKTKGRGSRPRRTRRQRIVRATVIGLSILLVIFGGGVGYLYYLTNDLNRVDVRGLDGAFASGQEAGTENILMVGSTSRCALKVQNPAYGLCQGSADSAAVNGVNSDVIMILHANPATGQLALLSIPRDLFIPNARSEGPNKIDAGLFEGMSQLVAAVQEDFGIPIQHAVSLNFDQFANIVDALGGINMSFPESVFDAESGLNVQAASCVHLNGTQALEVVRARHLQYQDGSTSDYAPDWPQEAQSDLARIRRDHEFLRVLATAVAKRGLANPITDVNLIDSVKSDLTFDQSWSVSDMANLVLDFHSVNVNSVPQLTLPVAVVDDPDGAGGGLMYEGANYNDVEFPAQSQDQSVIDQVLGISSTTDSMTGEPLPSPSSVTVSVLNGTGVANQAGTTATSLGALGFHTVGVGDTPAVGDVSETYVYYGSTSTTTEAAAEAVARSMTGAVIMAYDPSRVADGAQVTVVTGTQFAVNAPAATGAAASSTSSSPSTSASTATTTPASSTGSIATPSSATSNLQPWDPKACAAGANPTAPVPNET